MNDKTNEKRATDRNTWGETCTTPTNDTDPKHHICNGCGSSYIRKIKVGRWNGTTVHYGPVYFGTMHMKDFQYFDEMIKKGILTKQEKIIICGMSTNEGRLDAVQSYDSEALSAGAMQKTINGKDGHGEFPKQVAKFKKDYPQMYIELFEHCGWTVEGDGDNAIMKYQHERFTKGKKITGSDFIDEFRKNCNATTNTKITTEKNATPLAAIINAITTPEFQERQILDFIERLRDCLNDKTKYGFKIGDYVKSTLGRATILDHSVNKPHFVIDDFNVALHHFFHLKSNIDKSHNPAEWGESYSKSEKEIIDYYGVNRRMSKRHGKNVAGERYDVLKGMFK